MGFRKFVLLTHRWLGLGSSFVLAIAGTTGAVLLWPDFGLRRFAGPLHERLAMGRFGWYVVVLCTGAAVVLEIGGLYLWWKRKLLKVETTAGWKRFLSDLHHATGALTSVLMFLLAASGVMLAFVSPADRPWLRRALMDMHTAGAFASPVKMVYMLGAIGFPIQGVTGLVMWYPAYRWRSKS